MDCLHNVIVKVDAVHAEGGFLCCVFNAVIPHIIVIIVMTRASTKSRCRRADCHDICRSTAIAQPYLTIDVRMMVTVDLTNELRRIFTREIARDRGIILGINTCIARTRAVRMQDVGQDVGGIVFRRHLSIIGTMVGQEQDLPV